MASQIPCSWPRPKGIFFVKRLLCFEHAIGEMHQFPHGRFVFLDHILAL